MANPTIGGLAPHRWLGRNIKLKTDGAGDPHTGTLKKVSTNGKRGTFSFFGSKRKDEIHDIERFLPWWDSNEDLKRLADKVKQREASRPSKRECKHVETLESMNNREGGFQNRLSLGKCKTEITATLTREFDERCIQHLQQFVNATSEEETLLGLLQIARADRAAAERSLAQFGITLQRAGDTKPAKKARKARTLGKETIMAIRSLHADLVVNRKAITMHYLRTVSGFRNTKADEHQCQMLENHLNTLHKNNLGNYKVHAYPSDHGLMLRVELSV